MDESSRHLHIEHVHLVASKQVWAIVILLCSVVSGGFAYWMRDVHSHQASLAAKIEVLKDARLDDSVRLGSIKAQLDSVTLGNDHIRSDLRDLATKLDNLILEDRRINKSAR